MYVEFQHTATEILANWSLLTSHEIWGKAGPAGKWHYKCFDILTPLLSKSKHFAGF
jgi:hypothetical protein